MSELSQVINKLCFPGKGIFAADESINTMGKRLSNINLENTFENRTKWRNILSNCPKIEEYISGIILCEETLETNIENAPIFKSIQDRGVVIGIKVDQ